MLGRLTFTEPDCIFFGVGDLAIEYGRSILSMTHVLLLDVMITAK